MPSDYQAITAENIRRRGEAFDDIGQLISEQFYSDQTHFIYELIQNAEDALQKRQQDQPDANLPNSITFRLYRDRLEVSHYGKPFTTDDVIGISDILRGTKGNDPAQIGKFGIGFKSVYAFTSTPEVHSGDEHFRIERYIRPHAAPPIKTNPGETLFILPFDHHHKTTEASYTKIKDRLSNLGCRTLLFLSSIDEVIWEVDGVEQGRYSRENIDLSQISRRITLQGKKGEETEQEQWLLFERKVEHPEKKKQTKVEIAFLLHVDSKTDIETIRPINTSHLFVYFPTERETHLRFLIQGHYNTTPSRDNILINDLWNESLIHETAQLVVDALIQFRDEGKVNLSLLQTMPIHSGEFPEGSLFRPIYDAVRMAFQDIPLLPAFNGTYISAQNAKLCRSSELRQLLTPDVLPDLFGEESKFTWLSDEITIDRAPELRKYLMEELRVEEIDPEKFAGKVGASFFERRSDEWMAQFYRFLDGQKALWRRGEHHFRQGSLREKPFIRLEDGSHVPPFDLEGQPNAYLPPEEQTDFPVVRRSIVQDKNAKDFLINLGLQEPDLAAEVSNKVLPKYENGGGKVLDYEEHSRDIRMIVKAVTTSNIKSKTDLLDKLRKVPFLQGFNAATVEKQFLMPHQLYLISDDSMIFFEGNPDIWFLDYSYHQHREVLCQIGVRDKIQINAKSANYQGYVILQDWYGQHERGIAGFDANACIEGLDYAVNHPTMERSLFIWNKLLIPNSHLIRGTVESCSRKDFFGKIFKEEKVSPLGKLVIEKAWLPDKSEKYHVPSELSLDDLPEDFIRDENLARKLNMKGFYLRLFAQEVGVEEDVLQLVAQAMKDDPEGMRAAAAEIKKRTATKKATEKSLEEEPFTYIDSLAETFSRPSISFDSDGIEFPAPGGEVTNPEMRRERTRNEILSDIAHEPSRETRFKKVAANIWDAKDNQVRVFLREQYAGRCQICGSTFMKRDGSPYFEGMYLVSRTQKQWLDRPGKVLCLCANCCAKFQHGTVEADDIEEQILSFKTYREGGNGDAALIISLCGEPAVIQFTEKHLLDLQEIIKASR